MQFATGTRTNEGLLTARTRESQVEAVQQHTLTQGQTHSIEARPGLTVRSTSGVLWLTQEGESEDILLRAGRQWTASRAGRVVVQAILADATWTMHS